jgi:hypothetical protein
MTAWKPLTLCLAVTASGCGSAGTTSEATLPTPAVRQLAMLQQAGQLDPARLECSAEALAPRTRELISVLPTLYESRPARPPSTRISSAHARSVQQGMASGDAWNGALRRASAARQAAAQATAAGDDTRAAQLTTYAIDALNSARRTSEAGTQPGYRRGTPRWTEDDNQLLEEYAWLFRDVMSGTATPQVSARVTELGRDYPKVMDAYAALLLYTYVDPELDCAQRTPGAM